MDNTVCTVVKDGVIHGEADLKLMCKIINLESKQKELVNKVLDASDQCQEIIDMLLSSKNTMLDLVQKIVRADHQDLNLMRKITDLNSTEWDLFRKVIHLCDGKKYFIYKFMDWYLNDESLDFSCSSSGIKGAKLVGKNGPCEVKKHNGTVGQRRRVVSSYKSRRGNNSVKFRTRRTNQGTSTEKVGKCCRENGFSLCKTDTRTENRSVTKQVNLTEKDDGSAEYRSEVVVQQAQPTMTVKHLLCNEHLCSSSSESSEDVVEKSVSHIEHNDHGSKQKTMEELDCARDNGNSASTVTVVCGTSNTREDVTGAREEVSLNTKSPIPLYKNMEVKEDQTLALGTNHNCHSTGVKEIVQELPNIGMKQAITPLLPKQNMHMEVHEQQMYNGSLQGNLSDVPTSRLSAVESTGIQSQNDILNDYCVPGNGKTETQLDLSGKLLSKPSDEFVLKDCYIRLVNLSHVLKSKKTVNLKDLESPQGHRMKKSTSENEASGVSACGMKRSRNVSKRKQDMELRCYVNNAKSRRTQTSEDLGFQENTQHVLGDNEAVNLKDLQRPQENVVKESVTENKTCTVIDGSFKGASKTFVNKTRKRSTVLRCYKNNAKKGMQTSKGLGSQLFQLFESIELVSNGSIAVEREQLQGSSKLDKGSVNYEHLQYSLNRFWVTRSHEPKEGSWGVWVPVAAVKEKVVVEGHSDFEDSRCDKGKTCSGLSIDTADWKRQNLSSMDLRTVQLTSNEGIPEDTQFTGGYRQNQHRLPEIQNPEVMSREECSYQSIGNVQNRNALFLGRIYEGSAGRCVGETSSMWLRVKPEFNERTGMLWRPLSREAEKENVLGIQLQPLSMEQVGSLKW